MFWTCANEVTPISQAKRFYPLFAILGNLGPIASGQTMAYVSRNRPAGMDAEAAFERTLKVCVCLRVCRDFCDANKCLTWFLVWFWFLCDLVFMSCVFLCHVVFVSCGCCVVWFCVMWSLGDCCEVGGVVRK